MAFTPVPYVCYIRVYGLGPVITQLHSVDCSSSYKVDCSYSSQCISVYLNPSLCTSILAFIRIRLVLGFRRERCQGGNPKTQRTRLGVFKTNHLTLQDQPPSFTWLTSLTTTLLYLIDNHLLYKNNHPSLPGWQPPSVTSLIDLIDLPILVGLSFARPTSVCVIMPASFSTRSPFFTMPRSVQVPDVGCVCVRACVECV